MLTAEEKHQIDHEISLVPSPKNACIEALKIVQQSHGWVSDESLKDVAEYVGMSTAELDSVATFYNLIFRRPVGRHVILLCDSISCYVMGYEDIRNQLFEKLHIQYGQTTADGRFTILPNCCLGTCDCAPALMIDHDLYRNLTVEQLDEILSKYT
ncbi:NADH-quinone oxidoreductase subunit NuoE [Pontibacter kalidii]|uniref:NADH-quinone oxidoreductase subunit NuoE n=1 Tax=Pontibacter kalidii TaxID=2592049 RepID=UPI0022539FC7|nr:NADH-quinone oxidoreductase subunit NuoE [Pontibacter kalidii]